MQFLNVCVNIHKVQVDKIIMTEERTPFGIISPVNNINVKYTIFFVMFELEK